MNIKKRMKLEKNCLIYEERPEICRKFGEEKETHPMLQCPYKMEKLKSEPLGVKSAGEKISQGGKHHETD